jgi:PTS system mannose-specific IIA component
VAHGGLAKEYLCAMEHVVGVSPRIKAISIFPYDNSYEKEQEIREALTMVEAGFGTVIVTDMHGSTAANLALKAARGQNRSVLFGANLPLLLKLVKVRNLTVDKAVKLALDAGRKYIDSIEIRLE